MIRWLPGAIALAVLAVPSSSFAADDDAKAILTKAIKAHGGEAVLGKLQAGTSKNKGKITLPGVGEAEFTQETSYMLPDKFKEVMELSVAGQKVNAVTLVNGDKISIEANGTAVSVTDAIKDVLKEAQHLMKVSRMVSLLKDKGYELSTAGEIKVDDKPALGVRISAKGRKDITMYFDKETGLLAKTEHRAVDPSTGTELTEERIVQGYEKNKQGILVPKKVLVKRDGNTYIEAEVLEATMLEKLPDSDFSK